jgi:NAD(P)H-hydrate epimerase
MRALDRATIEDIGLPALTLMETAGRAVADGVLQMLNDDLGDIAVVCGPGNNGGDGFVAARVLRDLELDAIVYLAAPRSAIRGDAATHLAILEKAGGVVRMIDTPKALAELSDEIAGAACVIDALFGVGLQRPIEGHYAQVVEVMNQALRRLAVDIPSGLDADTGKVLGTCVEADATVTMAALKVALVSSPGFVYCGEVEVADIGVPSGVMATQAVRAGVVEEEDVEAWLPRPNVLDHKGDRGHVVIVGGMPGMRGAGRLCGPGDTRDGGRGRRRRFDHDEGARDEPRRAAGEEERDRDRPGPWPERAGRRLGRRGARVRCAGGPRRRRAEPDRRHRPRRPE